VPEMPEIICDAARLEFGALSLKAVRGFTLIELVMVIVLVGVLAIFVAPRLNSADFYARGFHDETLALLRYAQKTAIAQRRTVCVAFTAGTATLTIAAAPASNTCPGNALVGPQGESPATITARSGITYLATPGGFYFDALGQPSAPQSLQVANAGAGIGLNVIVEARTGYVHD
jgi:MSHA pilin protein MshC